ncbi:exopolysaccharide biosynthesis polyprenyl glycosylphosphotransferase [Hyphococcus sp.]|jgi:exopolysaccharide biosynthesis polyprenyl glycosylphosphotransferase|uniref:exopolysaccharide biosynthesis polyprenyl glycosylphosphotransferase n=1 Tax=Hyphococcus sp. TaxID=2038636 RepID=UPI003D10CCD0
MFAQYAFAFAAAAGAAAAAYALSTDKGRTDRNKSFHREAAETGLGPRHAPRCLPSGGLDTDVIHWEDFARAADRGNTPSAAAVKRMLDVVMSLGLVAFLSPLLLLTAIAIKLDSPGPVLYRQRRVGLGGEEFEVFKFRSMIPDAEANGPQYAAIGDKRITRVGAVIRKFRIDEIPQAINVLRGEMSFVGPRPERPEFVRELEREIPLYHCRHLVKPGITGWAQVKYEYAASVEGARTKLRYDLYYIRHLSPALDLMIVLMTIRVALFGLGSR